jgi:ferrochelatase
MAEEAIGILLLNLGGPDSPEAVRPFLYNLFSDRDIIRLGPPFMQKPLAWLIATRRYKKTIGNYALIGGASPILNITNAQADALNLRLREHGDFTVHIGMRYWKPFIEDTVRGMAEVGIRRLLSLSLYPQFSVATTGSSEKKLLEALEKYPMEYSGVSYWYDHPTYIDALVDVIRPELREGTEVLFSAHSLPVSFIEAGDPYVIHIKGTIDALAAKLGLKRWHLGYQSRSGPVQWLAPSTESELERLAGEGAKDILMVPISFVSDHIETLYEVDLLYKEMARDLGMELRRCESLNTHPLFIGALEDLVLKKARETGWL